MRVQLSLFAAAGVVLLAMTFLPGSALAAPKGWKCSYAVRPLSIGSRRYDHGPYYYACYGRRLSETRARARAQCRRRASCDTGACLPLDYRPDRTCGRE